MKRVWWGIGLIAAALVMALSAKIVLNGEPDAVGIVVDSLRVDLPGACGTLAVTPVGSAEGPPTRHRTTFVNDRSYSGMEDNDLRGFLDGGFRWGWNQPEQIHVRTGRKNRGSGFGEPELFRIIQRWDGVSLPPSARVTGATLTLKLESPPGYAGRVLLYEVKRDWNPGSGGTLGDNNSPPKPGEVWWNAARHDRVPWAKPGVGWADEFDPDADTGGMPLAVATFGDSADHVQFRSTRLAEYAASRISEGQPLRFLIKVSDDLEDTPGTRLFFYSGNEGSGRNPARRPELALEWTAPASGDGFNGRVHLERGRKQELPPVPVSPGDWVVATWDADPECMEPIVEVRARPVGDWRRVERPFTVADGATAYEVRVSALIDPVDLGQPFRARFRDTWIETAAPEDQEVPFTFVSPTGRVRTELATYVGDYSWVITFQPDEIGRWSYHWTQRFLAEPYRSAAGVFDVTASELAPVLTEIRALAREVEGQSGASRDELLRSYAVRLQRLERAAVTLLGPHEVGADRGREVREALNEVRSLIAGEPIPDPIPLEPIPPHEWRMQDGN